MTTTNTTANTEAMQFLIGEAIGHFAKRGTVRAFGRAGYAVDADRVTIYAEIRSQFEMVDGKPAKRFSVVVGTSWRALGTVGPDETIAYANVMLASAGACERARETLTLGLAMFGDVAFSEALAAHVETL